MPSKPAMWSGGVCSNSIATIARLYLTQQRVDLSRLKARELLLTRRDAPDDTGLLFGICVAAEDAVGAGNGRGAGQVLIHCVSEDQHAGRVDQVLHPGGQGQCLALAERGRDQARVWLASLGECQRLGAAARSAGYPHVSLPAKKRPDAYRAAR
jgi:hypothetical protein